MISTKRKILSYVLFLISIAILLGVIWLEKKETMIHSKPTLNLDSDYIVNNFGYFDLWFPCDENKSLNADAVSICLGDENIFVFLPGGTDVKKLIYYFRDEHGNLLGRRVGDFTEPFYLGGYKVYIQYSNLPVMFLRLNNREEYNLALETNDKTINCYGDMTVVVDPKKAKDNGWFNTYASHEGDNNLPGTMLIHGRGSSSWSDCDKRSFTLSLEKGQNLLGMGYRKDWNLISQAFDRTLIRNAGFNTMAERMGFKYQPEMQEINLYIDDTYMGVYLLTSKVKVGKNNINLRKNDILYNLNAPESDQYVTYTTKNWFPDGNDEPLAEIVYPKNPNERDKIKAQDIIQQAMHAIDDYESDKYLEYIDLDSWVKYYWIQEVSMNFDAWGRSMYCYYDSNDGKLYMDPVWDMDMTLGCPYDKEGMWFDTPEGYRAKNAGIFKGLLAHESFRKAANEAYFEGGLRDIFRDNIEIFKSYKEAIGYDGFLNYIFYSYTASGVAFDYGAENYNQECEAFIDFYERRVNWLDSEMEKSHGL